MRIEETHRSHVQFAVLTFHMPALLVHFVTLHWGDKGGKKIVCQNKHVVYHLAGPQHYTKCLRKFGLGTRVCKSHRQSARTSCS